MRRRLFGPTLLAALTVAVPVLAQQSIPRRETAEALGRAQDRYLKTVADKLRSREFRVESSQAKGGTTVLQIEIARNGRLVDAKVVASSGEAAVDDGILASVRQASPYPRLPVEIPGWSASFKLPVVATAVQR